MIAKRASLIHNNFNYTICSSLPSSQEASPSQTHSPCTPSSQALTLTKQDPLQQQTTQAAPQPPAEETPVPQPLHRSRPLKRFSSRVAIERLHQKQQRPRCLRSRNSTLRRVTRSVASCWVRSPPPMSLPAICASAMSPRMESAGSIWGLSQTRLASSQISSPRWWTSSVAGSFSSSPCATSSHG